MTITYFGYGSLVNTKTLEADARVTAGTLAGWRREWRAWWRADGDPTLPKVCTLTVARDAASAIQGVMVSEPAHRLETLNRRERRYTRVTEGIASAFRCDERGMSARQGAFLYEADAEIRRWGDRERPILQSYLDCVFAGFFDFWGEEGVRGFVATTHGWQAPVLADRHAPLYPRAQAIEQDRLAFFDDVLTHHGVTWIER